MSSQEGEKVMGWLVFNVGCLECGEESWADSLHETREGAIERLAELAREKGLSHREGDAFIDYFAGGQNVLSVFEVPSSEPH